MPSLLTLPTSSDGTVFQGCQHYMQTYIAAIADCQSPQCRLSAFHPPSCRSPSCNRVCTSYFLSLRRDEARSPFLWQVYGPDIERTTALAQGKCPQCLGGVEYPQRQRA